MKLKTSATQAAERGKPAELDIELLGTLALKNFSQEISQLFDNEILTDCNCFEKVFGFDCTFLYRLEVMRGNQIMYHENGLGYIENVDGKTIMRRSRPMYMVNEGKPLPISRKQKVVAEDNDYIIVTSYVPSTYIEILSNPHSVLASREENVPAPVFMEKNSILARLDDDIEAVPLSYILDMICNYNKQLSLKSSKLETKRIATETVQLKPSKDAAEKRGVMRWNDNLNGVEVYDGSRWRLLSYEDT